MTSVWRQLKDERPPTPTPWSLLPDKSEEESAFEFYEHGFRHRVAVKEVRVIKHDTLLLVLSVIEGPLEGKSYGVVTKRAGFAAEYFVGHMTKFGLDPSEPLEELALGLRGLVAEVVFSYYQDRSSSKGTLKVGLERVL